MNLRHRLFQLLLIVGVTALAPSPTYAGVLIDPGGAVRDIVASPTSNVCFASVDTGEVLVINMETQTIINSIPVANPGPLALSPSGSLLYVGSKDSYTILVFQIPSLIFETEYVLSPADYPPLSIVASSDRLYVNHDTGEISIVNLDTGAEIFFGDAQGASNAFHLHLDLTPDFGKLIGSDISDNRVYVWDVSTDIPVQTNETVSLGGLFHNGITTSSDGNTMFVLGRPWLFVFDIQEPGMLSPTKKIPLNTLTLGFPYCFALSHDGHDMYFVSDSNSNPHLMHFRTDTWLPYHMEPLDDWSDDANRDTLVLSGSGLWAAVVTTDRVPLSHRIEILEVTSYTEPAYGWLKFRAIDSVEGQPIEAYVDHWSQMVTGYWDYPQVERIWGPLQPTTLSTMKITKNGYENADVPEVTIVAGTLADVGDIVMTRLATGDYPLPSKIGGTPALVEGTTSTIQIRGLHFLPGVSLDSREPGISIDGYSRMNWATIEATITASSVPDSGVLEHAIEITNPGASHAVNGDLFRVTPEECLIQLTEASATIVEGVPLLELTVTRTLSSSERVSVDFQTVPGTATADEDYTAVSGTLIWLGGDSDPKTIAVPILQDVIPEEPETFTVELLNPINGAVLGANDMTEVTIEDDDSSTVRFTAASIGVSETSGTVSLTVSRTGDITAAGSVSWATTDGTAVAGSDYTSAGDTLDWGAGVGGGQTIVIDILDDALHENTEAFTVVLSSPGGNAFLGDPSTATVSIVDDDVIEIVFSTASFSADEGDGNATITAWRIGATNGTVTADFATSDGTATGGSDYTAVNGTLSWADGDTAPKTFDIPLLEDGFGEIDETVLLSLSALTGGAAIGTPGSATLTIEDNDGTSLQFTTASFNVNETAGEVIVTVERIGGDTAGIATIDYATADGTAVAGFDYQATSGTLSWADGNTDDKTLSVIIFDDGVLEGFESFNVALSNPAGNASLGTPTSAVIAIADDEWMEQLVNTETVGAQTRPDAAMNATGDSVVVWESYLQDGGGWGIFGQRFDADGNPVGSEFQVNSTGAGDQRYPAAAIRPDGSFTVVWLDSDADGDGIRGRRFTASGAPVGGDFAVNPTTAGDQTSPDVAVDGSGVGIVVWQSDATGDLEIRGRRLDATGVPTGSELTINSTTAADQQAPAVAGAAGGGFAVVWQGYGQDGPADGIIARLFAANGAPTSAEIVVNEWTAGNQISPAVCRAADGRILVAWEDTVHQDGMGSSIRTRWFSATGTPIGGRCPGQHLLARQPDEPHRGLRRSGQCSRCLGERGAGRLGPRDLHPGHWARRAALGHRAADEHLRRRRPVPTGSRRLRFRGVLGSLGQRRPGWLRRWNLRTLQRTGFHRDLQRRVRIGRHNGVVGSNTVAR